MSFLTLLSLFAVAIQSSLVAGDHTITLTNNCPKGQPQLMDSAWNYHQSPYTTSDSFSGRAWLTGNSKECGAFGADCIIVEISLNVSDSTGDLSSFDQQAYSDPTGFQFTGSCSGHYAFCNDPNCSDTFQYTTDYSAQAYCQDPNASIEVIFCDSGPSRMAA